MSLLHISYKMAGKMRGMISLNTSPQVNPYCQKMSKNKNLVCSKCYSIRIEKLRARGGIVKSWERNGEILSKDIIPIEYLPKFSKPIVRLHAHGELINETHYINFINLAEYNPQTTFVLWTKRKDLIKYKPPGNLILIYSNPVINKVITTLPKYFSKVFNVVDKKHAKSYNINCKRHCVQCLLCYTYNNTSIITERLK